MQITSESATLEFNLEGEVAKVKRAEEIISKSRDVQTPKAKIQKVPAFLRKRPEFCKFYVPKLLSIGPIHENENVKLGAQYKHMWTAMYLSRVKRKIMDVYGEKKDKIIEVINGYYSEEVIEKYKDNNYEALAWMLFVDGCSVLEFMEKGSITNPEALNIKIDQLVLMQQDLLLLENQIPFKLLHLLSEDKNELHLHNSMRNFLKLHHMVPASAKGSQPGPLHPEPTHLLDYVRNEILCNNHTVIEGESNTVPQNQNQNQNQNQWPRHRNMQELKAAGIEVTRLEEAKKDNISQICFSPYRFFGRLFLPQVIVDDSTATTFLNLIAYEMCPDFKNNFAISSYVAFLDSLIDHPDDVKQLRSAGILHNNLGSDEEVAKLFNTISTDLVPDPRAYHKVKTEMEKHCNHKYKTWMAEFKYTHFESPWSGLALLAAILVLVLTFIQTWYTIP